MGKLAVLESTGGIALGIEGEFPFQEETTTLEPGSMIVMYTDGVSEAEKEDGEMYEMDRFCQIFKENSFESAEQATEAVFDGVKDFVGDSPQSDDITCLVLKIPE